MLLSIYEAARNKGCQTTAYVYDERLNISSVINPMDTKRVIPTTRKAGWKALEIILVFAWIFI